MKKQIILRFPESIYIHFKEGMTRNPNIEQFSYILCDEYKITGGVLFIPRIVLFPDSDDLIEQSSGVVTPSKHFQASAYYIAEKKGMNIIDIHTHVHPGNAHLSSIDMHYGTQNSKYIASHFSKSTHLMIVFGNDLRGQEALMYDRKEKKYFSISRIEILGRGSDIRINSNFKMKSSKLFSRQEIIPLWSQKKIGEQRVFIAGMGGNGSAIFQGLLCLGAGSDSDGWIVICDNDVLEESNLARIAYANPDQIGIHKVKIAYDYALKKMPETKVITFPCKLTEPICEQRARASTVLIGAGDNDGVRKILNSWSIKYGIPYIDLGCEIHSKNNKIEAGGQVRVVIPRLNACLVCCGGYNASQAVLDLMDSEEKKLKSSFGYFKDQNVDVTPSVINLNGIISFIGISAFLSIVLGKQFGSWDLSYYNQITGQVITAQTNKSKKCPLCCY